MLYSCYFPPIGINAVLKSVKFTDKDAILVTSWTYNPVKNIVDWVSEHTGIVKLPRLVIR